MTQHTNPFLQVSASIRFAFSYSFVV